LPPCRNEAGSLVYEFSDEMIREIYDEAEEAVLKKIKTYDDEHVR
jgi:hypothetical protein